MTETFRIPSIPLTEPLKDKLKAKAAALGVPVQRLVEQTLEMLVGGEVSPIVTARTVTVEDAGEILLAHIEPSQASLILDLCRDHGRKPYEYLLSYVYLAHERGETAMLIGEQFLSANAPRAEEMAGQPLVCEWAECRKPLVNPKRGQRFCPDPDDGTESCGRKYSLAELHRNRAGRTRNADNRHAPTQVNVDVYRRASQTVG